MAHSLRASAAGFLSFEFGRFWRLRRPYTLEQNTVMISTKSVQTCSIGDVFSASLYCPCC